MCVTDAGLLHVLCLVRANNGDDDDNDVAELNYSNHSDEGTSTTDGSDKIYKDAMHPHNARSVIAYLNSIRLVYIAIVE